MSESITIGFEPPTKPWSTNQDRNLHPKSRYKRIQQWKDAAQEAACEWADAQTHFSLPLEFAIVTVQIPFESKRRRDPHNYCGTVLKAIVDGLVNAGLFEDDTGEFLGHREPRLVQDGRVEIRLEVG